MRKLFFYFVFALFIFSISSCTDTFKEDENIEANDFIDPGKECPPEDRNCNGIPDDEEG